MWLCAYRIVALVGVVVALVGMVVALVGVVVALVGDALVGVVVGPGGRAWCPRGIDS